MLTLIRCYSAFCCFLTMVFIWFWPASGISSNLSFGLADCCLVNRPTRAFFLFLLSSFFLLIFYFLFCLCCLLSLSCSLCISYCVFAFLFALFLPPIAEKPRYSAPNLGSNVDLLRNRRSIELPPWDKWQRHHLHRLALSSDFDLKCFR